MMLHRFSIVLHALGAAAWAMAYASHGHTLYLGAAVFAGPMTIIMAVTE